MATNEGDDTDESSSSVSSSSTTVHVSWGRGLHHFRTAGRCTVAMLKAAVCTDYDAEAPLSERPRPPQMWSGAHFEGKPVGFVREYLGYSLGDYEAAQLLPDEAEIQDGTRVYLVTG